MKEVLSTLIKGQDLTTEKAKYVMAQIMTGEAGEVRTAALLTALAAKGETGPEIEAFARSMRKAAVAWPGNKFEVLGDTCGTGGDSSSTLNISTLSAILLAAMGIPIAKHGNRAVSSKSGSADLLEAMEINLDQEPEKIVNCLEKVGIGFLFAQKWHPAMRFAGPVRKAMGVRTVFNLLGPLTNPAPVTHQVLGIFDKNFMPPVSAALAGLGRKGAYVVHSEDGLDEVSLSAPTNFTRIQDGQIVETGMFGPEDFGVSGADLSALQIDDREAALERSRAILAGQGSDAENSIICVNAALLYSMATDQSDLKLATGECMEALKSGKGAALVEQWQTLSHSSTTVVSVGD